MQNTIFLIHFGWTDPRKGRRTTGFYELDDEIAFDRDAVVKGIVGCQFEDIDFVIEVPADAPRKDISGEIAEEVLARLIAEGSEIPHGLRDFIETHHGLIATHDAIERYPFLDGIHVDENAEHRLGKTQLV